MANEIKPADKNAGITRSTSFTKPSPLIRRKRLQVCPKPQKSKKLSQGLLLISALLELISGVAITGLSLWYVIYTDIYKEFVHDFLEIGYFGCVYGSICFLVFILMIGIYKYDKTYSIFPMTLAFICTGLFLLLLSFCLGLDYPTSPNKYVFASVEDSKTPLLMDFKLQQETEKSLRTFMDKYKKSAYHKCLMDKVQQRLECCGIFSDGDWKMYSFLPTSCCSGACTPETIYREGCLNHIAFNLKKSTFFQLMFHLVCLIVQVISTLLAIISYMKAKYSF